MSVWDGGGGGPADRLETHLTACMVCMHRTEAPKFCGMFSLVALVSTASAADWSPVDLQLDRFRFLPKLAFSVGDRTGRRHSHVKGGQSMRTRMVMASSSKFPAALAVAGAVQAGALDFDTPAHAVFKPWWTSDPADNRSLVTLRHLLTLTSGLVSDDFSSCSIPCLSLNPLSNASRYDPEDCAKEIYELGPWRAPPGVLWSYHSLHLQLAGAMAARASNTTLRALLETQLLHRVAMPRSFWLGYPNPHLAAAMVSCADDYDALLHAVLTYRLWDRSVIDEMERDVYVTFPGLRPARNKKDEQLEFYGHYSMCTYYECIAQSWSERCAKASVHADPGAFGYWPLIDRQKQYYMQIATERHVSLPAWATRQLNVTTAQVAALPAICVSPLRFEIQPGVERSLGLPPSSPPQAGLNASMKLLCWLAAQRPVGGGDGAVEEMSLEGGDDGEEGRLMEQLWEAGF